MTMKFRLKMSWDNRVGMIGKVETGKKIEKKEKKNLEKKYLSQKCFIADVYVEMCGAKIVSNTHQNELNFCVWHH